MVFWRGDPVGENGVESTKTVSQANYYAYRVFQRWDEASTILQSGKLFQQYIVDGWAAAEQSRLNWVRHNQGKLRSDLYHHVVDAFSDSYNITILRTWAANSSCLLHSRGAVGTCVRASKTLWQLVGAMVDHMPL